MENKTLSDKRKQIQNRFGDLNMSQVVLLEEVLRIIEEQDKQFIKDLKDKIPDAYKDHVVFLIDKLAGEKLI